MVTIEDFSNTNERIKMIRLALSYKQEEFAKTLNVSRSFISFIEKGSKNPSFELLKGLNSLFNVDINWVLTGKGSMFIESNTHYFLNNFFGKYNEDLLEILNALKDPVLKSEVIIAIEMAKKKYKDYFERKNNDQIILNEGCYEK